jgi:hypothetical protein
VKATAYSTEQALSAINAYPKDLSNSNHDLHIYMGWVYKRINLKFSLKVSMIFTLLTLHFLIKL